MYDTLKHYQSFVSAGMTEQQARALVYAIRDAAQEIRQARENAKKVESKSTIATVVARFLGFKGF